MQMIGNGTYELGVGTVEAGGVMVTVSRGQVALCAIARQ